jgi:hypothetical protein
MGELRSGNGHLTVDQMSELMGARPVGSVYLVLYNNGYVALDTKALGDTTEDNGLLPHLLVGALDAAKFALTYGTVNGLAQMQRVMNEKVSRGVEEGQTVLDSAPGTGESGQSPG